MRIKSLKIKNFRNIAEMSIIPSDEMNVIYGENAQGKTNLIEAIWLLTGAKSFRGSKDDELRKFGEQKALISADFKANCSGDLILFLASISISFIAATRRPAEPVAKSHTYESLFTLASLHKNVAT